MINNDDSDDDDNNNNVDDDLENDDDSGWARFNHKVITSNELPVRAQNAADHKDYS